MEKINLMIPMNGLGSRFRDENYYLPKPLINVVGKPMIFWLLDNLDLDKVNTLIIPYTSLLDDFDFQEKINERYPALNVKFFPMNYDTRGAAETVFKALENQDESILNNNLMLMDCDTFYFDDIIDQYLNSSEKNNIFYFNDKKEQAIYSYIKIENNQVIDIREKEKISDNANCGIYCFESGHSLMQYCERLLESNRTEKNEFYISGIYRLMLQDKVSIGSTEVKNFHCVGTPLQLKIFCEQNQAETPERFCFDLDRTLVTAPDTPGDYSTCRPREKTINLLRHLKSQGHYIIIYTARRMRTYEGKLGVVMKEIGQLTYQQLDEFGIPYDELHFGKPWAAFYIDDLAVNVNQNLEKQIGYYNSTIKSRFFNEVEVMKTMVIKHGNIDGERHYYQAIEQYKDIADLFPKMLEHTKDKIIIERIHGLNYSYLLTNDSLTDNQFSLLLSNIKRLHDKKINDITSMEFAQGVKQKLLERYNEFDYGQFYQSRQTLDQSLSFIDQYYAKEHSISIIHGDPVFTNILIDNDSRIKFIDMRGKIGDQYTISGDPIYDIAKIYQSLSGYDSILNNTGYMRFDRLIDILKEFIINNYDFTLEDVRRFAGTLYFSLIPLHNNEKCQQYYQLARELLQEK